jgi:hypothetical protein
MPAVSELSDEELASFGLAGGRCLLVESPFSPQPQILAANQALSSAPWRCSVTIRRSARRSSVIGSGENRS